MHLQLTSKPHLSTSPGEGGLQSAALTYWTILFVLALALASFILAFGLAMSWIARPFLGFVVEQTLVVADYDGDNWNGRLAGLRFPQHLTHINDRPVSTTRDFDAVISNLSVGQDIHVRTRLPDGSIIAYPSIRVQSFPAIDLARLFWLPYGIGLAYLLLGVWVFRVRGHSLPGRAFAYFCANAAIVNALLFDLITTHAASAIWTAALAQLGGALISLALLFPVEWELLRKYNWVRFWPYLLSTALAGWGLLVLRDSGNPWAYVQAWRASYVYTAAGILFFLAMMAYRFLTSTPAIARQQVRIILAGSLVAFLPVGVWLGAPLFGVIIGWNPALFLPLLLVFPLSIAVAIQRYRLLDIDFIVNRTLVYGLLSAALVLIYLANVMAFEWIFRNLTGEESPLVIAFSTLAIAMLFNPLRMRIQDFIDRRFFRQRYSASQALAAFSSQVRDIKNPELIASQIGALLQETIQPDHYEVLLSDQSSQHPNSKLLDRDDAFVHYLQKNPESLLIGSLNLTSPLMEHLRSARIQVGVPLVSHGELVGLILLGSRLSEQGYSIEDFRLLNMLAAQAAPEVRVAQLIRKQQAETLKRERIENELRIARLIQQTLVPINPPAIPGWIIEAHYQPAREVGGDFYDFIQFEDGRLGVMIGDVTDKGIPAALVMASTRGLLRSIAYQFVSPGEVLKAVNQALCADIPQGMFVTCLYAVLDTATGKIAYANAGHNLPYHRTDGGISEFYATGMPLGLMLEMEYDQKEDVLHPGDCLLLYSDGLVEAHNESREMFGEPRLRQFLEDQNPAGPGLLKCVLEQLHQFTGPVWEQEDDVTLVALHRPGQ